MLMSIIMMTMVTTTIKLSDCSFYEVIITVISCVSYGPEQRHDPARRDGVLMRC